jgi:hypothetical protein
MGPWLIETSERAELERWLGDTASGRLLMVVRGDSPRVRELLPNLLDAAKLQPNRVVLWVRDATLLEGLAVAEAFARDPRIVAVVLAATRAVAWVYDDQSGVADASFAFDKAG